MKAVGKPCAGKLHARFDEGPLRRSFQISGLLYTNSPDEHFILDLHPETPLVSIAAGFSGHGFKFCSVIGEIMADFALEGGCDRFDLNLFRINRKMRST